MLKRILFVCTGNTCRSPLAESLLRHKAEQAKLQIEVSSAGVAAIPGGEMSQHSRTVLANQGIEGAFSSQMVDDSLVDWSDCILTMTSSHKQTVISRHPQAIDKIYTLHEFVENDPNVLAAVKQMEQLLIDLQLKHALGQQISESEQEQFYRLQEQMPNFDVADPFGGDLQDYEHCAEELSHALDKLIEKLSDQQSS